MAGKTNDNMTGDGKAVDAHIRNKEKPEGADHLPLKDDSTAKDGDKK